jgi:hypothetical protein
MGKFPQQWVCINKTKIKLRGHMAVAKTKSEKHFPMRNCKEIWAGT